MTNTNEELKQKVFNMQEFCKIIGLSRMTVIKYQKKGALPDRRNPVNNYRFFTIEDVENFIKSGKDVSSETQAQ